MANFAGEIQNFERHGAYVYKFDNVGNLIFDGSATDFSRVYLSFPITNFVYNISKIQTFYDPTFLEFVPPVKSEVNSPSTESNQHINSLEDENASLKNQLISLVENSNLNENVADKMATKQVILELRIASGQGRFESDFNTDFPYSPLKSLPSSTTSPTLNNLSKSTLASKVSSNQRITGGGQSGGGGQNNSVSITNSGNSTVNSGVATNIASNINLFKQNTIDRADRKLGTGLVKPQPN